VAHVEEALKVDCPRCLRKAGDSCVYTPVIPPERYSYRPKVLERIALTGTPTKRPHNERFAAAEKKAVRRALAAREKARQAKPVPGPSDAVRAVRADVLAEHEQMRDWLRRNSHLFGIPPR
jgi:hypothetical protein